MRESIDLKTLQRELQEALKLIKDNSAIHSDTTKAEVDVDGLNNTQSLLVRCAAVVEQDNVSAKPTLRIIHHFACSGGTLISKCLAAQPNVFLLSEINPLSTSGFNRNIPRYTPRDISTQAIYGRFPEVYSLAENVFLKSIVEAEKHTRNLGGFLVVRAHTHADYCVNDCTPELDTLTRILSPYFDIKNLVTVRDPVDSYISLQENKWVHFNPKSFDEYCKRLVLFTERFEDGEIFRYEDFVASPEQVLFLMSQVLCLRFSSMGMSFFDIFKVSGDSGRSGVKIEKRPRKLVSKDFKNEIFLSEQYEILCNRFGYGL